MIPRVLQKFYLREWNKNSKISFWQKLFVLFAHVLHKIILLTFYIDTFCSWHLIKALVRSNVSTQKQVLRLVVANTKNLIFHRSNNFRNNLYRLKLNHSAENLEPSFFQRLHLKLLFFKFLLSCITSRNCFTSKHEDNKNRPALQCPNRIHIDTNS